MADRNGQPLFLLFCFFFADLAQQPYQQHACEHRREGIDPDKIYGYEREEFTHTSVAAQIASGTADAGMGIYSAAKLYDLDFLPICMEQYDLLIPDYAWETPMVRRLIEVLRSDTFRTRISALGGYELDSPGRVRKHF